MSPLAFFLIAFAITVAVASASCYGPRTIDLAHLDPAGTPIWMKIKGDPPPGTVAVIGGERIPVSMADNVVAFNLTPDILAHPSQQAVFLEHRGFISVARSAEVQVQIGSN